ncbi:RND transporter [Desulfonema ishimotonii]|uniref:RND transporter n=1 Tax=Desulfonema ishimotonii TaxID=45657 RepID=A0A401FWJ7_9BACT|nr:efflux transporter outer membrane subunit [Desulfonema ishimotonii]GBC61331.1 RND transporter [Desulfonema ishimotonii]
MKEECSFFSHRPGAVHPPAGFGKGVRLAVVLILGLLCGCTTVGPDYTPPAPKLPDAWHQAAVKGMDTGRADFRRWWGVFNDPVLARLIERARKGSPDLRLAAARIREARASLGVASGEQLPAIDGSGLTQRGRSGEDFDTGGKTVNTYSLGLDASWEIDFWGRISRSVASAEAGLQATVEDYRDALVLLYAEVAGNYTEVRTLQAQIRYAEANVGIQRDTLQVTRDKLRAEIAPALDVRQAELNLATTESEIPSLKISLTQAVNRLAVLCGEYPGALYPVLAETAPIPAPPDTLMTGLPADLLRQRPDIRRAERSLAAQTARIGVATADLYPAFSLSGTFGFESLSSADLFESGARAWSLGPAFRWNLFNGGRVRSQIRVEEALTEQALVAYEQTVLGAVEDVENAMVSYVLEKERRALLEKSVTAARKSVELVSQLYKIGLTDFQNLLDMQRSLFQQQDALAESEGNVTRNLIQIYRALGGGWGDEALPKTEPSEPETIGERVRGYGAKVLNLITSEEEIKK